MADFICEAHGYKDVDEKDPCPICMLGEALRATQDALATLFIVTVRPDDPVWEIIHPQMVKMREAFRVFEGNGRDPYLDDPRNPDWFPPQS